MNRDDKLVENMDSLTENIWLEDAQGIRDFVRRSKKVREDLELGVEMEPSIGE